MLKISRTFCRASTAVLLVLAVSVPALAAAPAYNLDADVKLALKTFDVPGMAIAMDFRPGDIQWLSNYAALHSRTEFQDFPEPQRKRHLLRLWLSSKTNRPVVPGFGKNGVVQHRAEARSGAEHPDARFSIRDISVPRLLS